MKPPALFGPVGEHDTTELLWHDADRVFCRLSRADVAGHEHAFMPVIAGAEHPTLAGINRLAHEYELKDYLDSAWALRPLELVREHGRNMLVVEYTAGAPLDRLLGQPMETGQFLRLALAMSIALGQLHERGLIHRNIKPANVFADTATGRVWLTGFGIASRLPRERQSPGPPEFIAGTLAYMAPEQTGRVNRSIDSRSDLYSLGVTFYEMLTGSLPFTASDPMEWVHCQIAKQPTAPSERVRSVPTSISAISMKLLSKTAEERYQTAAGVESDLRRCLSEWEFRGTIGDFVPGDHDVPDRLMIPEKLYGRDGEVDTLLTAFDRVVSGGRPELVLVSGFSGIGKSAVVNELHKPLVPPRGLFASGKFDQYKRDIPYATLAQAFQSLIRPLLSKNEEELRQWRDTLQEALAPNGLLVADLVPDLKHIIGEQPPVPELPPQEAKRRFQLVVRRFIGAFARAEHPLALFLDDLQWLDAATLDLLEDLLTSTDLQHLLLIGAYRDNEVDATHPLVRKLDAIREAGGPVQDIVLAPLSREDLSRLLADSVHCGPASAAPLASMIHEKTTGNPFFTIQFIAALSDEGLLSFDYNERRWVWDLIRIHEKGFTDNVVELMVGKLSRLPTETQEALQRFACMGNRAEFDMLRIADQGSLEEMHDHLWEAVRAGLIFRADNSYRFLHDRVQEAAYSLIPNERRAETHLRIGMLLAAHSAPEHREEAIFEIVNQLNRGSHLIASIEDREMVADLNLMAGRRAKSSTAHESALTYLRAGSTLLSDETWESNYPLVFWIEYSMAECEILTADKASAERRLSSLPQRARNRHDFCAATRLRLTLYTAMDRMDLAVDVFLDWLRGEGTAWSNHPSRDDVMGEYDRIWMLLGNRTIEDLVDMPLLTDPDVLDTMDVFTEIMTPAQAFDQHLSSLVLCRMVNLSLEHGNCDASCFAYVWVAMFAGPRFNNFRDGFRFGQLGYDLVEKRGLTRYQARIWMNMGSTVLPWARHPGSGRELVRRACDVATRLGDVTFASYSWIQLVTICLAAGDPLAEVQTESENGRAFSERMRFGFAVELCEPQLGLAMTLRGLTPTFGRLDHGEYTERDAEDRLTGNANLVFAECYYWIRKSQARFLAGDFAAAVDASLNADRLVWTCAAMFESAEHRLYGALAHAAIWDTASPEQRPKHLAALTAHHQQLAVWAEHNPVTFENRTAIVGAEIARIEGRTLDAEELYEKAIRSAHTHGFVNNEALNNEIAGRFYAARGFEKVATAYLRDARFCYLRWGADGKARQLELLYPHIRAEEPAVEPTTTIHAPVDHLDISTVIKVSEAVSGEIVLEKLIDALMRTAIEHAGAERGLLILPRGDDYRIEAEAMIGSDDVHVVLREARVTAADLPMQVFRYVLRTNESVVLHDAFSQASFSRDDYVREHRSRSVLCLPLLKQSRLVGVLYLENHLARDVFSPARIAILRLLASAAAISIENIGLYRDLQAREVRVRRLVDANIIGIFIWNVDGRTIEANDAFLQITGYTRDDLASGQMQWKDLTPVEWREVDEQRLADLQTTGIAQPYEKELFRKDGTRVSVLIGAAIYDGTQNEGVAFVVDLSDRNRAEEAARASERRFHGMQLELAHANRIATVGQLSASIAHEINQPLSGIIANVGMCLRMLTTDPPNSDGARDTVRRTLRDANRASEVVARLRALFAKRETVSEAVDLNELAREVIALSLGDLQKGRVTVRVEHADNLPLVSGDRVQLQQVILNMILNARDAMSEVVDRPRELVIRTERREDDSACLDVRDSGVGLDPLGMSRVFDAFYTTKRDGMGMGLSVSRSIIDRHHGRLWATQNDGPGATFSFSIPSSPRLSASDS